MRSYNITAHFPQNYSWYIVFISIDEMMTAFHYSIIEFNNGFHTARLFLLSFLSAIYITLNIFTQSGCLFYAELKEIPHAESVLAVALSS